MIDMASKQIIPAIMNYTKTLADTILAVKAAGADTSVQSELLNEVSALLVETKTIPMYFRLWKICGNR